MSNSRFKSWQQARLEYFLAEHAGDLRARDRCVKLSNPEVEREIDDIVLRELWPGVVQAMRGRPATTWTSPDNATAHALTTQYHQYVTRSLTFLIVDLERPVFSVERPSWDCRFTIETTLVGYRLLKSTILSFPEAFPLEKLTRILKEPLMRGNPAELGWRGEIDGCGAYSIILEGGGGADWSPRIRTEEARESIRTTVNEELDMLSMMDTLAQDWSNATAFDALHELLAAANLAY